MEESHEIRVHLFSSWSTEDIAATTSTDEVLSHIQVGHSLLLESRDHSQTLGYQAEIRHVEVCLFAPDQDAQPKNVRIVVYSRERDRKTILESLEA